MSEENQYGRTIQKFCMFAGGFTAAIALVLMTDANSWRGVPLMGLAIANILLGMDR